ncbi:MAG: hypothetical protein ACRCRR_05425, partial [Rickettsia sp.]
KEITQELKQINGMEIKDIGTIRDYIRKKSGKIIRKIANTIRRVFSNKSVVGENKNDSTLKFSSTKGKTSKSTNADIKPTR